MFTSEPQMYKVYFHQVKNNSNESDSMRFDTLSRAAACYRTTSLEMNNNNITFQCVKMTHETRLQEDLWLFA